MQRLLRRVRSAARLARGCGRLLVEAMAFHEGLPPLASAGKRGARRRRKGRNPALRRHARRDATLRFLTDPDVPFTDKEAGRDLRMMKLGQKISGGFRSASGAEEFATLRTIIATAQKQGRDILDALASPAERLITNIQYARTETRHPPPRSPTGRADTTFHDNLRGRGFPAAAGPGASLRPAAP